MVVSFLQTYQFFEEIQAQSKSYLSGSIKMKQTTAQQKLVREGKLKSATDSYACISIYLQ